MAKSIKLVTGEARLSYLSVYEKTETLSGKLKYQASVIIPKSDKATIKAFNDAFDSLVADNQDIFKGVSPKLIKGRLRDGDEEKSTDEAYANSMFFNCSSDYQPPIFGDDSLPLVGTVVSGDYGRVSVNAFVYNAGGSKGIGYGLNSIMKTRDGEKLGGSVATAADFA